MRAALAIVLPAWLAAAGCEQPAYEPDAALLRMLGDSGPIEPASARDCDAMIQVARQVYRYGSGVAAPRLSGDYYQNCKWAEAGITFERRTPDNRFVWVSFSRVQTDATGSYIDTYRSNDGDGLQHTRCSFRAYGDRWLIANCADRGVIMQQGQG